MRTIRSRTWNTTTLEADQWSRELATAHIPWSAAEIRWARRRPAPARTPLPTVGDEVRYRHDQWTEPVRADVTAVQSMTDIDDPNLWRPQLDEWGEPVLIEGRPVMVAAFDPNPTIKLHVPGAPWPFETREARMRGEPGWLPLDWRHRRRPLPRLDDATGGAG